MQLSCLFCRLYVDFHILEAVYSLQQTAMQGAGTAQASVWNFIHGLCAIHQQSQFIIDELDREFAAVPALCVRQWIRHCLLAHNLSTQIQALVSYRPYLLQYYLGMLSFMS